MDSFIPVMFMRGKKRENTRRAYTELSAVVESDEIVSGFSSLPFHIPLHSEFSPVAVYYSCNSKEKKV